MNGRSSLKAAIDDAVAHGFITVTCILESIFRPRDYGVTRVQASRFDIPRIAADFNVRLLRSGLWALL